MPSDNLTFFIGFAAIFVALGWYLWRLEQQVTALRRRVDDAGSQRGSGEADGTGRQGPGADPSGIAASPRAAGATNRGPGATLPTPRQGPAAPRSPDDSPTPHKDAAPPRKVAGGASHGAASDPDATTVKAPDEEARP